MVDDSGNLSQAPLLPLLAVGNERFSDNLPLSMLEQRSLTQTSPVNNPESTNLMPPGVNYAGSHTGNDATGHGEGDISQDDASQNVQRPRKCHRCTFPNCNKSFYQKTHLDIHISAHAGDKPFHCATPGCGQSFSHLNNLKSHERRHNEERLYNLQERHAFEDLDTASHSSLLEPESLVSDDTQQGSARIDAPKNRTSILSLPRPLKGLSGALDTRLQRWIRGSRFHGWRMGVLLGCCMSSFVLCCNISMIIVAATTGGGYDAGGIASLKVGDEVTISRWNTALHVLINALSTMLLAGSNYTMQVLSSPTRQDVDAIHARGDWLDVGILSPRNLRLIPRKRAALWCMLGLSSVPLHLFYNASVFKVITSSEYRILAMGVTTDDWKRVNSTTDVGNWTGGNNWNLTNGGWIDVYNSEYVSLHGDLYLGIDRLAFDTTQNLTNQDLEETINKYLSLDVSGNQTYIQKLTMESSVWIRYEIQPDDRSPRMNVSAHVVQAASEKRSSPPSRVQVSLYFLLVVLFCNLSKLSIMAYVLITDRSTYLVTLGDAAASFLERADPHTLGVGILGREELLITLGHPPSHPVSNLGEKADLELRLQGVWLPRSQSYFAPVHRAAKVWYTILLLIIAILLALAPMYSTNTDGSSGSWSWGTASDDDLSLGSERRTAVATLWNAWLANVPQLMLSFGYLTVNMICTAMAGADEWNHLATSRKGLRVTKPAKDQRSTYFLQLPYRWSLPLIVTSGTLHWLLSQSFFLVRADFYDRYGTILPGGKSACGFSALSLFVLLFASLALLCVVGFIGLRTMSVKMPLAASCSLVISAACHPSPTEANVHLAKVKWGVTRYEETKGFPHCSLSSEDVTIPQKRQMYR